MFMSLLPLARSSSAPARVLTRGRLALALVAALSIVTSAGCSSQTTASSAPAASPVEQPAASPVVSPAAGGDLSALTAVVTKTRAAVEAGDEAKAKTEFEQFEAAWKPVEDGIKEKNPKAYEAIEEAMDGVSGQLSGNLDKAKALAALSSLEGAIGQAK
jgi:soluble cytochrome b562